MMAKGTYAMILLSTKDLDGTFERLQKPPYAGMFTPIPPRLEIPLDGAAAFGSRRSAIRSPRETKGEDYAATADGGDSCCG